MATILDKSFVCPVVIGRGPDLQLLDQMIARSIGGAGQIALISGEAGIGKSRLLKEAKARAATGTLILEGYCFQTESALPYAPFLDLFRNFLTTHSSTELAQTLAASAPQLVELLPELADHFPHLTSSVNSDPKQEKQRLFQMLIQAITKLAQTQPLIVAIEDLHWSDSTSLEFLLLLARRITYLPILLLLTYRSEETTPELTQLLASLDRERLGTEFALKPMDPTEVDAMLRATLDLKSPVSREFLDTIFPLTEGNPFFIEEVLKVLLADGGIFYADGTWDRKELSQLRIPRTIQAAVQSRIQHLDEQTLQALTFAAVTGRRFDFRLLQQLLAVNEAELMTMLKRLVTAQLVVEETLDHFAFRHTLIRETIYTSLLLRERQAMHRLVGEAMENLDANSLHPHWTELSYHYFTGGVWQKALEYSQKAGEQARRLYAQHEAIVYYSRALVAARNLKISIDPELLSARGRAYEILGDFKSAQDDFEQARKIAQEEQAGKAEWQTLIDSGRLWISRNYQQAGEFFRQAEELARQLNEPSLIAHSLNRIGNWFFLMGKTTQALECHRQALAFFQGERDEQGMAETRDLLGMASLHHGDQIGSYAEYQHAIRLFRKLEDKQGLIPALIGACHALYDETDFVPGQSSLENQQMAIEALELARLINWPSGQAFAEWGLSIGLATRGMFGEALAHANEAFRIATEIELPQRIMGAYQALGYVHVLMLQALPAIQNFEAGFPLIKEFGSAWMIGNTTADLASAYLLNKETARARALLDAAQRPKSDHLTRADRRMLLAKGYLFLAENNPTDALHVAEQLLDARPTASASQPIPALLKLKGEALMALKQWQQAEQALEPARHGAAQREAFPLLWQIHALLGRVYKNQKNIEQAEREFASARQLIHKLGTNIVEERLREAFLRSASAYLPKAGKISRRQSETGQFGGLTPREREVTRYVSQGKSNREIAEELVLSERTVENHVGNILTKLNFTSRSQIAVWAAEKGLSDKN